MWKLCSVVSTWLAFYLRLSKIATPSNIQLLVALSLAGWRRRRLLARTKRVHQQQTTKHEMRKCNETWKATTEIKKNYYEHYASENKLKKIKINCVLLCFSLRSPASAHCKPIHSFHQCESFQLNFRDIAKFIVAGALWVRSYLC